MVADPLVMPLAQELLSCLDTEVAKVDNPPVYVSLRPGTVVDHLASTSHDECCEGLAWVRPGDFYPSSETFPVQDATPLKSELPARAWAVTLEMGSIRCAPTPDATTIPTSAQWHEVTQTVMDDAAAMRRAICCMIDADNRRRGRILPGRWQPIAVQGGCVGGILLVTLLGPSCDCLDSGPSSS